MPKVREVDPDSVFVEQRRRNHAEEFVADIPLLNDLELADRTQIVDHVARMLTAVDITIFDAGEGAVHVKTSDLEFPDGTKKILLFLGTKQEGEVVCEAGLFEPEHVAEILRETRDSGATQ